MGKSMVNKRGTDENFAAVFSVSSHSLSACRQQTADLSCRGFTLVELIMVVAVLGVLSAMAIPSFSAYFKTAKVAACAADLRTIEKAVASYMIENNAMPPNLSVAGMGNAGSLKDPWHNNYNYIPHAVPTIPNDPVALLDISGANVLNTDYDLYSMGEDGASNLDPTVDTTTLDDIARSNDGSFVGVRP